VFSKYIFDGVLNLASRFINKDEVFQDYMVKLTRNTFNLFVLSA